MNKEEFWARLQIIVILKWCVILLVLVAFYWLLSAILDPFFVYYQIPQSVEVVTVVCSIAILWALKVVLTSPKIKRFKKQTNKTQPELSAEVALAQAKKKYAIALGIAGIGIFLLVHASNKFDRANQLAHYQNIAIAAMQSECDQSCDLYGVTQDKLIGPHLDHVWRFEPHSGKRDYLFSWHSTLPKVTLTEHIYNYDGKQWVSPEATDIQWIGKQIPQQVAAPAVADDTVPVYTAVRKDFKSVIADEMPEIMNAYRRAKLSDPDMSGDVKVHIMVDTYGQVTAASIVDSDLDDADFENNLVYLVKGLDFESGQFAPFDTIYTFNFD